MRPILMLAGALCLPALRGQGFEVASIRPNRSGDGVVSGPGLDGRSSHVRNATLKMLIAWAYGVPDYRISGGPKWLDVDRFDIEATVEDSARNQPCSMNGCPMLRPLLAGRFHLILHRETRQLPVYALVVAAPGKLGSSLRESPDGEAPRFRAQSGLMTAQRQPISQLASALAGAFILGRPVLDRTGLTGTFDFTLEWMPDNPARNPGDAADRDAASIFTAIREQLGLRLEPSKEPLEVLLSDSAEQPSPN